MSTGQWWRRGRAAKTTRATFAVARPTSPMTPQDSYFFGFGQAVGLAGGSSRHLGTAGKAAGWGGLFGLSGLFFFGFVGLLEIRAVEALLEFDDGFADVLADFGQAAAENQQADDQDHQTIHTHQIVEESQWHEMREIHEGTTFRDGVILQNGRG
jgi:hypothetical protein